MNTRTLQLILITLTTSAILLIISQNNLNSSPNNFQTWKQKYQIKYETSFEEEYRQRIFLKNLQTIRKHNENIQRGYDMGVNQFTAMTDQQFMRYYLDTQIMKVGREVQFDDNYVGDVDWVQLGAVTPVKNQGRCVSGWAFATTGTIEGLSKISDGNLKDYSEQQLIDCSMSYGNLGCNGGLVDYAYKYIKDHGGIETTEYPYTGTKQTCLQNEGKFKISSIKNITSCNDLAQSLTGRPIAVAIDAGNWTKYETGIFHNCGTRLNHFALLVGITNEYWKLKNNWGVTWGQKGYIRLSRGNTCGICNVAAYVVK